MRMIFLTLLVVNLVYALAYAWQSSGEAPTVRSGMDGTGNIELLSDVFGAEEKLEQAAGVEPEPDSSISSQQAAEGSLLQAAEGSFPQAAEGSLLQAAEGSASLAAEDALLESAELPGASAPAIIDEVGATGEAGEVLCLALGPLGDLIEGQRLVEALAAEAVDVSLRVIDEPAGDSDYRVLIPPAKTLEDAFRKLRELQAVDIDSYVLTAGENALGISLGLFSTRAGAESAQRDFAARGYETQVSENSRVNREYWLFRTGDLRNRGFGEGQRRAIEALAPDIEQEMRSCPKNNITDV